MEEKSGNLQKAASGKSIVPDCTVDALRSLTGRLSAKHERCQPQCMQGKLVGNSAFGHDSMSFDTLGGNCRYGSASDLTGCFPDEALERRCIVILELDQHWHIQCLQRSTSPQGGSLFVLYSFLNLSAPKMGGSPLSRSC